MKIAMGRVVVAVLFVAVAIVISGCVHEDEQAGNLPWSRPASWEGQQIGIPY